MKSFSFTIKGHQMEHTLDAYEPFPGAPFVVHRPIGGGPWHITHRGSTFIASAAAPKTLAEALRIAKGLSELCPSAPKVGLKRDADGSEISGRLKGPYRKLQSELAAAREAVEPK